MNNPTDAKSTPFTVSMIRYTRAEMEIPAEGDQTPGRISITVDGRSFSATFVRAPELAEVPYPVKIEPNLVVEFYSR